LIVHIASLEDVKLFATRLPIKGLKLARRFWPGPLTLVVKRKSIVPNNVTAGLKTVALRVPNHPVTLKILRKFRSGIVGPSANTSSRPSPTTAEHVYDDLKGKIDLILDAGPTEIGVESTVVDVTIDPPVILRLGGLSKQDIENEIGKVCYTTSVELLRRSPGTRHRHYAPRARVILIPSGDSDKFKTQVNKASNVGKIVGTITHSKRMSFSKIIKYHIMLPSSLELFAHNIFRALRELDKQGVDLIIVEGVEEQGIGAAIMDRLRKAALLNK
jgi:L-threonylcarbamoyladenylate synthase